MDIFIILLLITILIKCKFSKKDFHYDCMDKSGTPNSLRGVFAVLIFLSHSQQYLNINSELWYNKLFLFQNRFLGQLIVSMFLFYSGFGIMQSYLKKPNYFSTFPKKRIFKTLFNFDIAIILFLLLDIILQIKYSAYDIAFSFIGWTSVGNSNWYIFAILACYLIVYISHFFTNNPKLICLITTALTIPYCVLVLIKQHSWWSDTIFTFVFGMWFSVYYDRIKAFLTKNNINYFLSLFATTLIFFGLYFIKLRFDYFTIIANLWSISFVCLVTLITLKLQFKNRVLDFLGKHSFDIYILQRIPMIIFSKTNLTNYNILFVFITFGLTLIISILYNMLCNYLDKKMKL